jgi:hypothetical protein
MRNKLVKPQAAALAAGLMAVASYVQACYLAGSQACATAGQPVDLTTFPNNAPIATTFKAALEWDFDLAQSENTATGYGGFTTTGKECAGKAIYVYHAGTQTATWWEASTLDHSGTYHIFTGTGGSATAPSGSATCHPT